MYKTQNVFITLSFCFFALFFMLFFSACANRSPVTGGPKDTLVPLVKESIPLPQSLNYSGNTVIIAFNEWIKEDKLRQELLITPPTKAYTHKIIRNRLEIKFDEPLLENTTYNLNFRNAIKDINEDKNISPNLKLAFSTGNTIDSCKVLGGVRDFLSNAPLKDIIIALYKVDDTLKFGKHEPYYFTLSQPDGAFEIENVKTGKYFVYALADKDNNTIYNEPEAIAFLQESLLLTDSLYQLININLKIASEDTKAPEVKRNRALDSHYEIEFDEGLANAEVEPKENFAFNFTNEGKTLKLYNLKSVFDSLAVRLTVKDSIGNQLMDTLKIAFKKPEEKKRKGQIQIKEGLEIKVELEGETGVEKALKFDLIFNKPIARYDLTKINYWLDRDTVNKKQLLNIEATEEYRWDATQSVLSVNKKIDFKEKIRIDFDSLTFFSMAGDTNSFFTQTFPLKDPTQFGTISGQINTAKPHYILQLLNDKAMVMAERINPKKFEFEYLPAGNYSLRVIIDSNNNRKWDSSKIAENLLPEEILFFELPNKGKLKEKWDIQGAAFQF